MPILTGEGETAQLWTALELALLGLAGYTVCHSDHGWSGRRDVETTGFGGAGKR